MLIQCASRKRKALAFNWQASTRFTPSQAEPSRANSRRPSGLLWMGRVVFYMEIRSSAPCTARSVLSTHEEKSERVKKRVLFVLFSWTYCVCVCVRWNLIFYGYIEENNLKLCNPIQCAILFFVVVVVFVWFFALC